MITDIKNLKGVRRSACWQNQNGEWKVNWHKLEPLIIIENDPDPFVLWIPPKYSVSIEYDKGKGCNKLEARNWIYQAYDLCIIMGLKPSVYQHDGGFSPYLWISFDTDLTKEQKDYAIKKIVPLESIQCVDFSNTGRTLCPIPGNPHWKYGSLHKFIIGYGIETKNIYPENWNVQLECLKKEKLQEQPLIEHHTKKNSDTKINDILTFDYKAKALHSGCINGYPSPSEGRMALLVLLASYGLSATDIHHTMSSSHGLNWHKKKHLNETEINKAINYSRYKRRILKNGTSI